MAQQYTNFMGIRVSDKMMEMIKKKMEKDEASMTEVVRSALAVYLIK
jgi:hypothetical protein